MSHFSGTSGSWLSYLPHRHSDDPASFLTFTLRCVLWSVTFCIERLGHFRICICNFHRWCVFADFWCILILRMLFNSLCVFFYCMNLLQHIKYYQLLYVFGTAQTTSISVLQYWYHRRSIATGLVFSSPAFSVVPSIRQINKCKYSHGHRGPWWTAHKRIRNITGTILRRWGIRKLSELVEVNAPPDNI